MVCQRGGEGDGRNRWRRLSVHFSWRTLCNVRNYWIIILYLKLTQHYEKNKQTCKNLKLHIFVKTQGIYWYNIHNVISIESRQLVRGHKQLCSYHPEILRHLFLWMCSGCADKVFQLQHENLGSRGCLTQRLLDFLLLVKRFWASPQELWLSREVTEGLLPDRTGVVYIH